MDCKHERQARLDQWIEDQTGSACAFCLKAEVERLEAELEQKKTNVLPPRVRPPLVIEPSEDDLEIAKLRKALEEIRHDHNPPGYKCRITEICDEALKGGR